MCSNGLKNKYISQVFMVYNSDIMYAPEYLELYGQSLLMNPSKHNYIRTLCDINFLHFISPDKYSNLEWIHHLNLHQKVPHAGSRYLRFDDFFGRQLTVCFIFLYVRALFFRTVLFIFLLLFLIITVTS